MPPRTRRFTTLEEAIEAANDNDTIAVIPPDGSDEELFDDDDALHEVTVSDVAGMLEIIDNETDDDDIVDIQPRKWRSGTELESMPAADRLPTIFETHPILETLSPLQLFQLFFTKEISEMISQESEKYARQQGDSKFTVTSADIDQFIMLVLYSSYMKLPRQDMYWNTDFDIGLTLPAKTYFLVNDFVILKSFYILPTI